MTKLLGSILIIVSGILTAQLGAARETRRLSVLDGWIELLVYIRSQIDCYLTPVGEILEHADPSLLKACTAGKAAHSLTALLSASLPYLDPDCRRLLRAMVREIGTSYREEQLKRCDYYIDTLHAARQKLAEGLPARIKLNVTLSICAAIGTAILLW